MTRKILSGNAVDGAENIFHLQAANFTISSTAELTGDIDGEIGDALPLEIKCLPRALRIFSK